jgi:hypothetical protein
MGMRLLFLVIALVITTAPLEAQATPRQAQLDATVARYCGAWGEKDSATRDRVLAEVWATDGVYVDQAPTQYDGRAALSAGIDTFQRGRFSGATIRCSGVQSHHGYVRFTWTIVGPNGATMLEGMDFGELDADGRIKRIVGFFGPPPAVPK